MGGPHLGIFHVLHVLCVLLALLGSGPQNTRASATMGCAGWCPPSSICVNATACRCAQGFISSSGEIITNPSESCDDINECGPPLSVTCGKLADCQNTEGSYYCMCNPGYRLASGATRFSNASQNTCQDVNECTSGQNPCHKSIHCINTVGSYRCRCRRGWKPVPGSPNGPDNTVCEDVDECTSGQNPCHKSARCVNTMGSYRCRCFGGWKPVPGSPNGPNNTVCEEVPFPTWTPPPGIKSQSLSRFFEKVQGLGRDPKPTSPQDTIQIFIKLVDELLEDPGDLEALTLTDQHRLATHLLSYLEEVLRTLAKIIPENFIYHSPSKSELSLVIQEQGNGTVIMGQSHARMRLNWAEAVEIGEYGPTIAGMFSSQNMQRLLANAPLDLDLDPEKKTQLTIFSAVNTVFLSNRNTEKLNSSVDFAFSHLQKTPDPKLGSRHELICAFWKGSDGGGYWATTGCQKLGSGNNSTTCRCSHLSSFAILMAHYDVEDPKLTLITKVGLSLSLVCLLLCILTFLLVRPIQGSRTTVHLHLSICLFLGSAIFLAGIENEGEGGQVSLRCRLVTGLLHYCFLASFCWMSLEGLELYFLVVHVFRREGLSKRWLYLIGYGIPGLIVAISVAVSSGYYHERTRFCWLTTSNGFLWSFNGPVTFIILCNAIIFVITIWKLTLKFSEINPDMKKLKKARVLTITAMAQLVVLGGTWVSGLFLFERNNYVLAYLFTILSCLQGFFIFLLHCLLNKKVREEYRKWAYMVTGNKYSDFTTSTSNSSNNQTKVLRPSESGM